MILLLTVLVWSTSTETGRTGQKILSLNYCNKDSEAYDFATQFCKNGILPDHKSGKGFFRGELILSQLSHITQAEFFGPPRVLAHYVIEPLLPEQSFQIGLWKLLI